MRAELANLEIKYRKGELGEEEYQKKVAEAKKKGAKIQYQIEMAQWASNILAATANTAVGVTQALAQGGFPAGIIMGALVGAAGAVQLASIMAAKPIKHFAAGGFVGGMNGATTGGDNTTIAARNGELMVNATQQARIWRWTLRKSAAKTRSLCMWKTRTIRRMRSWRLLYRVMRLHRRWYRKVSFPTSKRTFRSTRALPIKIVQ